MSIWDKYPDYTGEELRILVKLTVETLASVDSGPAEIPKDVLQISSSRAVAKILPLLEAPSFTAQEVQKVIEDDDLSRQLCLRILGEVRRYPDLASHIADSYEAHQKKMAVPELMLLTGALVILAIKIKSISWGSKKKEITFYESSEAVKKFLTSLVTRGTA